MSTQRVITEDQFNQLLAWLSPEREEAGTRYEEIRRKLIQLFIWGGCGDAEGLADEAITRVAKKAHELGRIYKGNPALYFHGVAKKMIQEQQKRARLQVPIEDAVIPVISSPEADADESELEYECLQQCLQHLSADNRELILDYYCKEKQAKIDYRKALAERLGIETNALRVRVYRIRATLEECIKICLNQSNISEMN